MERSVNFISKVEKEIYDIFAGQGVRFYVFKILKGSFHNDVEDIINESYEKALRKSYMFEGRSSVKTWVYSIIHNVAFNWIKKENRRFTPFNTSSIDDPEKFFGRKLEDPKGNSSFKDDIAFALRYLSMDELFSILSEFLNEEFVEALRLDFQGYAGPEAALELGIPQGTFKSRLYRARKTLDEWNPYLKRILMREAFKNFINDDKGNEESYLSE